MHLEAKKIGFDNKIQYGKEYTITLETLHSMLMDGYEVNVYRKTKI